MSLREREAVTLFQRALDRDPNFADAAAELALTYEKQGEEGYLSKAAAFEPARRAAVTALKLDPKSARAHYALSRIYGDYDWDWAAARRELQQVAMLAPGGAHCKAGRCCLSYSVAGTNRCGRLRLHSLETPLDPEIFYHLTLVQMRRDQLPEAEAAIRRLLDIRPTFDWGHNLLGHVLLARGRKDAALLEMQQETTIEGKQQGLAIAYYALGREAESADAIANLGQGAQRRK